MNIIEITKKKDPLDQVIIDFKNSMYDLAKRKTIQAPVPAAKTDKMLPAIQPKSIAPEIVINHAKCKQKITTKKYIIK